MFKMMINKVSGSGFNAGSAKNQKVSPSTNGNVELQTEKCEKDQLKAAHIELAKKKKRLARVGRKINTMFEIFMAGDRHAHVFTGQSKMQLNRRVAQLSTELEALTKEIKTLEEDIQSGFSNSKSGIVDVEVERNDSSASAPLSSESEVPSTPNTENNASSSSKRTPPPLPPRPVKLMVAPEHRAFLVDRLGYSPESLIQLAPPHPVPPQEANIPQPCPASRWTQCLESFSMWVAPSVIRLERCVKPSCGKTRFL